MDVLTLLLEPISIFVITCVILILYKQKNRPNTGFYSKPDWNYRFKKSFARKCIDKFQKSNERTNFLKNGQELEYPKQLIEKHSFDSQVFYGIDQNGNLLVIKIERKRHNVAMIWLQLRLSDGSIYQLPNHPDTTISNNNIKTWCAGGIKFGILDPFKRLRITFNGVLRKSLQNNYSEDNSEIIHCKFNFIWSSCSPPQEWPVDQNSTLLAEAVALDVWKNGDWLNAVSSPYISGYDQYGALLGTVLIDGNDLPIELNLPSLRSRRTGQISDLRRNVEIIGSCGNGTLFHFGAYSRKYGPTHCKFGSVRESNSKLATIHASDIHLSNLAEDSEEIVPNMFISKFKTNQKSYTCLTYIETKKSTRFFSERPWSSQYNLIPCEFRLNTQNAKGIIVLWNKYKGPCNMPLLKPIQYLCQSDLKPNSQMIVTLTNKMCQSTSVVGGKGSSLALLSSMKSKLFSVPEGFCLTVSALEFQLEQHPELEKSIKIINLICTKQINYDLKAACKQTVQLFLKTPVHDQIVQEIINALSELRKINVKDTLREYRFAIRSSAVGEDSEETSAAGQNKTILGAKEDDHVITAVQECWSSLFAFQSVEYRRQHGLPIKCGLGIVIQLMVPAETSGVMFTCHPTTEDPSKILITANYGLGESVVSALVEPDTLIVNRSWDDNLSIDLTEVGSKTEFIIMSEEETKVIKSSPEQMVKLCLSIQDSLKLAEIGIKLEKLFGGHRDIEWAIFKEQIYLLQARPITSFNVFTNFELTHEFDTPILTDQEITTCANVGEALPGAMSVLTYSVIIHNLEHVVQRQTEEINISNYYNTKFPCFQHHININILSLLLSNVTDELSMTDKMNALALFGRLAVTKEMHQIAKERFGVTSKPKNMLLFCQHLKKALSIKNTVNRVIKLSQDCDIDLESGICTSSSQLYQLIDQSMQTMQDINFYYSNISMSNIVYELLALNIMMEGSKDFTVEHFQDISILLSSCNNIISADIPKSLKEIALIIDRYELKHEFLTLNVNDILDWLQQNCLEAYNLYLTLLKKHGHRGVNEMDIMATTYGDDPSILLKTLQRIVNSLDTNLQSNLTQLNPAATVYKLITPKRKITRFLLKHLLRFSRNSVKCREDGKSAFILAIHKLRIAYRNLAILLLKEGKIPHADIVYYLTHYEIGLLVVQNNSELISKAMCRTKMFPIWNKLRFNAINFGIPKPEIPLKKKSKKIQGDKKLKGTSVYPGFITGRACVILSIDEAENIIPGDILITHSTNIEWSPYFPILGGIVTELGGLISHGAVVAREYGLPCIVGAQGATGIFQTGEEVLLAATNGEIMLY